MLKTVVTLQNNNYVLMTLPNEYLNRPIEILVFPVDVGAGDQESPQPLSIATLDHESQGDDAHAESLEADQEFWETFGSWQDDRSVEEIIEDIYASRTTTERKMRL